MGKEKRVTMAKRLQLVCQQLENISRAALEEYQDVIRQYVRRRNGIYALYRRERLYYVGLAKNLRTRLKQHLADRHRDSWDRFSIYLTIGEGHLKEMESLLLRIAKPAGNKQSGKFVRCENLRKRFAMDVRTLQREELNDILGRRAMPKRGRPEPTARAREEGRGPVLALYQNRPRRLRGRY